MATTRRRGHSCASRWSFPTMLRAVHFAVLLAPLGHACRLSPSPTPIELQRCPPAIRSAGDHAALFHLGTEAVKTGELLSACTLFQRAKIADPSHQTTLDILSKLELLDIDDDDGDLSLVERSRDIDGGRHTIVTLAEASDATGATAGPGLWASAPSLVDWLCADESRRALFEGKTILELGSGSGFVGLSLAKLGAAHVRLTDLPQQLPILNANVDANGGDALPLEVRPLAWGASTIEPPPPPHRGWDLIVATDVTYDADLVPLLATTLSTALRTGFDGGGNPKALLALPRRFHFSPPVTSASTGETILPDSALLFELLRRPAMGGFQGVKRLDTVPVAVSGGPADIDIFTVSVLGACADCE